jgi:hypothetical protein
MPKGFIYCSNNIFLVERDIPKSIRINTLKDIEEFNIEKMDELKNNINYYKNFETESKSRTPPPPGLRFDPFFYIFSFKNGQYKLIDKTPNQPLFLKGLYE